MKKYELLNHTADIGIKVSGKTLKELFENAAFGMYDIITDASSVDAKKTVLIELESDDRNQLLKEWLSELLYYFNNKNILLSKFLVSEINDTRISSEAKGELFDKSKHKILHEIKAVTYHSLDIQEKENLFTTDIIFDT